jgi:aminoglycoside phosphotransferase (APT) family kinase protein
LENPAPNSSVARAVAEKYLNNIVHVERVPKGASTFVFRVITNTDTYYLRFLPEEASFATEVLAHNALCNAGVSVPQVVSFEHKNALTGLSAMLITEIPGKSIEDDVPKENLQGILFDTGRQLARIHTIPVDGSGWVDKACHDALKGEKRSFDEYFTEYLDGDLEALGQYPFTGAERIRIESYMRSARTLLNVREAVLVHGDFDISHIFHCEGKYSGIIDFGESRGNNRLYDLATFVGFYQERTMYEYLLQGYGEAARLTQQDLFAVELLALFILLRFLGKKVNTPSRDHWYRSAKAQLEQVQMAEQ